MADYGIFIGWGASRSGKEMAAASVFQEAITYWSGLKAAGEIEDLDIVLLGVHGGDLGGFALLQGDREKLARLKMAPEWQRLVMRGGVCLDGLGVVDAQVNDGVTRSMQQWSEAIADLV